MVSLLLFSLTFLPGQQILNNPALVNPTCWFHFLLQQQMPFIALRLRNVEDPHDYQYLSRSEHINEKPEPVHFLVCQRFIGKSRCLQSKRTIVQSQLFPISLLGYQVVRKIWDPADLKNYVSAHSESLPGAYLRTFWKQNKVLLVKARCLK